MQQSESRVVPRGVLPTRPTHIARTVPLSALLQFARVPSHIDYMSLDVEGYELAAIMSGARTLTMTPWP